ncbi:hypothetical protein CAP36_11885 [Chitinophagaceae bacterium IBVUCB2]|nr:hypothetical protein CAP36_11885 [Chitinophagaceae bacterium IBVUCB2]
MYAAIKRTYCILHSNYLPEFVMASPFKLHIDSGIALYVGRNIQTKLHTHHAVEIVIAFNKPFLISRNGSEFEKSDCSIIAADLAHQFEGQDDFYIFLYFDAELQLAQQLEQKLKLNKDGIIHYFGEEIETARKDFILCFQSDSFDENTAISIIQNLLLAVTGEAPENNGTETRITEAIQLIQSSLHSEISLENIASAVFLSESRFAHLFKEQIGIPFRRYVLWCRMQAALKAVLEGKSFTEAAYEGGFADLAHLSRTFTHMFGVSPSDVLKQ